MKVTIDSLGLFGEGVAKVNIDNNIKPCFIDFSLPNEVVDIDIISNKSKYLKGKLNSIIDNESKDRVIPKCKYFTICGGCNLQHMSDNMQKTFKSKKIAENLRKIGHIDKVVFPTVRLNDFYYRNKMVFMFDHSSNAIRIGMYEEESHNLIDIDQCLLANKEINLFLKLSKQYFSKNLSKDYTNLKYLVVRYINKQMLVTIVSNELLKFDHFYEYLCNNLTDITVGLSIIISNGNKDILSGKYIHLNGIEYIKLHEFGIDYVIDNRGFLQINNDIKAYMYNKVLDCINVDDTVIDAYSGAGLLSAIIAKKCKNVVGIEINMSASQSAIKLCNNNNINNVNFICGDVGLNLNKYLNNANVVVLDPPRAGCDDNVISELINANGLQKIIYISCDSATLSRDLAKLCQTYKIKEIVPMDMFPQTKHVETLVVLVKN